ncbi:MAG: hypothetical protein ACYTG0_28790 [Planctomycetota bacterium]|jgi:3-oxoacyl-[acyl-carrier-protein] synthase-1
MTAPLAIVGVGAVTPVGLTAPQTCAAIRARLSGYGDAIPALPPQEPQIGAIVPAASSLKRTPFEWLVNLAVRAIRESLPEDASDSAEIALLLAVPEAFRQHPAFAEASDETLFKAIESRLQRRFHPASTMLHQGHAAVLAGIAMAQQLLVQPNVKYCVLGGVDSLINSSDVERLGSARRLFGPENPQGLIPGEGAAFIVLTLPDDDHKDRSVGQVLGVGTAVEKDTVLGERYSVGCELRQAMEEAVQDARRAESDIRFRVSDMNGERYRGWESTFAFTRFYRTRREELTVWHPASSVGDIGAAAGSLLVIVAAVGIARGYAPGLLAMCEASSEEGLRAACLVGAAPEIEKRNHSGAESPHD